VLSKTCHSTEIFGRSSTELRDSFGPVGQNFSFGRNCKGMFGAPLLNINALKPNFNIIGIQTWAEVPQNWQNLGVLV